MFDHLSIVTRFSPFSFTSPSTNLLCFLVLSLFLTKGCTVTPSAPPPPPTGIISTPIEQLLFDAADAFDANRLTTPRDHNAYNLYLQVLAIDPDNKAAREGINAITEQYLSWAIMHTEQRNFDRARQYVSKAQSVDPTHPNIRPVLNRINSARDSRSVTFQLDRNSVLNQDASKIDFQAIAKELRDGETFVSIMAPTDASGRWLYQKLNSLVDFRIPAEFVKAADPAISLRH